MGNIYADAGGYNPDGPVHHFYDKLKFRMSAEDRPSTELLQFLRENCHRIGRVRKAHHIAGTDLRYSFRIVAPNAAALLAINNQPWLVNEIELARNRVTIDGPTAERLHDRFDQSFVQPWHGKHETRWYTDSKSGKRISYSGQRRNGLRFAWYSHAACKYSGAPNCFHAEARVVGAPAVARIGIRSTADLLRFDHAAFWRHWDMQHKAIDVERLGRWHLNQLEGRRRQKPRIHQSGRFSYNVDRRTGGMLKRILSQHPRQGLQSVQWFVDRYGRGPYLLSIV